MELLERLEMQKSEMQVELEDIGSELPKVSWSLWSEAQELVGSWHDINKDWLVLLDVKQCWNL